LKDNYNELLLSLYGAEAKPALKGLNIVKRWTTVFLPSRSLEIFSWLIARNLAFLLSAVGPVKDARLLKSMVGGGGGTSVA